jgi:hypothetical protein
VFTSVRDDNTYDVGQRRHGAARTAESGCGNRPDLVHLLVALLHDRTDRSLPAGNGVCQALQPPVS